VRRDYPLPAKETDLLHWKLRL